MSVISTDLYFFHLLSKVKALLILHRHCHVLQKQVSHAGFLTRFLQRKNRRAKVDIAMGRNPRITHITRFKFFPYTRSFVPPSFRQHPLRDGQQKLTKWPKLAVMKSRVSSQRKSVSMNGRSLRTCDRAIEPICPKPGGNHLLSTTQRVLGFGTC